MCVSHKKSWLTLIVNINEDIPPDEQYLMTVSVLQPAKPAHEESGCGWLLEPRHL